MCPAPQWERNVDELLKEVKEVTKYYETSIQENVKAIEKATSEKLRSFPKRIEKVLDKCSKVSNNFSSPSSSPVIVS